MPEMPPVSTHAKRARVESRSDVYGRSTRSHDPCAGSAPSPEMPGRNVSATTKVSTTKVSTTKVSAANVPTGKVPAAANVSAANVSAAKVSAAVTTAVSRGSLGCER